MPILVVDDDPAIRQLLSEILQDEGYPVASAANGAEALTYLRHNLNQPCLVLLDLNMPVMSGWEFRVRQVQDPNIAAIPVVVISAMRSVELDIATLGIREYLAKPIDFDALLGTVQ